MEKISVKRRRKYTRYAYKINKLGITVRWSGIILIGDIRFSDLFLMEKLISIHIHNNINGLVQHCSNVNA